ncbi:MAG TPA: HWE histidine kinase domain-containing protein [Caulobacteraceae bacterium]|nr:HWE histidine kinase domain-containing protein [Caulobacteraceae bacterium]
MAPGSASYPSGVRLAELLLERVHEFAILVLDLEGRIVGWSPGAERVTGWRECEVLGQQFALFFADSDRAAGEDRRELRQAMRDGRAEDTRWHVRKSGERFWANGVTIAVADAAPPFLIKVLRDETPARLAEEQRVLLLHELNHRINNTLATIQAMVEQTLRAGGVDEALREDLSERLIALSAAHGMLVENNWAGADLHQIIQRTLAPYDQGVSRIHADGPPVRLSPRQAMLMTLVLHELATNAVKYGALSTPQGAVRLAWNIHLGEVGGRHLTFLWEERGGPTVSAPTRRGFGSRLIAQSFAGDGRARIDYPPQGVSCSISVALSGVEETPAVNAADRSRPAD